MTSKKKVIDWSHLYPNYAGKWVAFAKDNVTVVSEAKTFKSAINKAKKAGERTPIMFKVPKNQVLYVGQV